MSPRARALDIGNALAGVRAYPGSSDSEGSTEESEDSKTGEAWDSDDGLLAVTRGLEWWQASLCLISLAVGMGVMAIPQLPRHIGFSNSFAFLVFGGAVITESAMAMWKGIMAANEKAKRTGGKLLIKSYEDFGKAAFGKSGESAVVVLQCVYFTWMGASLVACIGDQCANLDKFAHHPKDPWMESRGWMVALYPVVASLALLPNVAAVFPLVPVALVGIGVVCCLVIVKAGMDSQLWQEWPDLKPRSVHPMTSGDGNLGFVVLTFLSAYSINANVPSVLSEMKDPHEFPFALKSAVFTVVILYTVIMAVGYYAYGDFMQDDLVQSLTVFPASLHEAFSFPPSGWTGLRAKCLAPVMAFFFLLKLIITLPLTLMAFFQSVQTCTLTRRRFSRRSAPNILFRLAFLALVMLVAALTSRLNLAVALACTISSPTQCLIPLLFGYRIRFKQGAGKSSMVRRFFHMVMVVAAVCACIIVSATCFQQIWNS